MAGHHAILRRGVHVNQRLIANLPGFTVIPGDPVLPKAQVTIVPVVDQSFASVNVVNFWVGDRGGNLGSELPTAVVFWFR